MVSKNNYLSYEINEVPELGLISYTQSNSKKFKMFNLENMYFLKTNKEKIDTILDIVKGDYVIFDTETTGLNKFGEDLPFQISAKKYRDGKVYQEFNVTINVGQVSNEILELTGFTQEKIDNGIKLEQALKDFLFFIKDDKYVIAHNADFDIAVLNNSLVVNNIYLEYNIKIYCSMQIYYTVYKHIFKKGIIGSSLDQLALVLFGTEISEELRHNAEYDVELVNLLLDKIYKDLNTDLKQENGYIAQAIEIDNFIEDKNKLLRNNARNNSIVSYVHDLGKEVANNYNEYLEINNENINIINAVSLYIEDKVGVGVPVILRDEYSEVKYYVQKNKPYSKIDDIYTKTYNYNKDKIYLNNGIEISFFIETMDTSSNITINSEETLALYLNKLIDNRQMLLNLQLRINNILKMIKEHRKRTGFNNYGDKDGIYFQKETVVNSIPRTINPDKIREDYNAGLIQSVEDLEEMKGYNTSLIVEQNLTNLFNN